MCALTVEELRPGSEGVLFLVAGAGGATDELVPVAEHLTPGIRVVAVALRASPQDGDTVESLAGAVVAAIRADRPDGPYRLVGYSFGGVVALEAARLLTDAGDEVTLLGLVDPVFDQRHWPSGLFARASADRAVRHARDLAGKPPATVVREVSERSGRLAHRLRSRHLPAAAAQSAVPDSPQAANLAVLAQWSPQVLDHPVTLFTATVSDFGCDLAELWQPWLPQLQVRRVWGSHLELTQSADGAARLAEALSRELAAPPRRLRVLVATTFRWSSAARLAVDLDQIGCTVHAVAPRGSLLHEVVAVERSYRLSMTDPVGSLRDAVEESACDAVIPFDDRTREALHLLHTRSDPQTLSGARVRDCLERSLGTPGRSLAVPTRAEVIRAATTAGVRCPPTAVVGSETELAAWMASHPGQAVLKTDGSWGGRGVSIVADEGEGRRAWRHLRRRPSLARALKRLLLERDPWPLRAWTRRTRPTLSVQSFVPGRPANAAIACFLGSLLGSVQAEVIASDGPTGPSTVLRVGEHPDITYAAKSVVSQLELSGLCGLDFIVDAEGHAHLLELNARATPTSHLVAEDGTDPLSSLRSAWAHDGLPTRAATYPDGLVALFPQELQRDPGSRHLRTAHHDVPTHAPDLVALALARARPSTGVVATPISSPPREYDDP